MSCQPLSQKCALFILLAGYMLLPVKKAHGILTDSQRQLSEAATAAGAAADASMLDGPGGNLTLIPTLTLDQLRDCLWQDLEDSDRHAAMQHKAAYAGVPYACSARPCSSRPTSVCGVSDTA